MPKVKQYKQNFRNEWLNMKEFKNWLKKDEDDLTKAQCITCNVKINAKYYDIVLHMK